MLERKNNMSLVDVYRAAIDNAEIYPNTEEDLKQMLAKHKDLDTIFITSANRDHLWHLNTVLDSSSAKNVFMEKPGLFYDL
jgi:glyoxylase-like metal-dependent hydrolase (beta-lactamase superfamily II)